MKLYKNVWTTKSVKFAGRRIGDKGEDNMRGERRYLGRGRRFSDENAGRMDGSQWGWKRGGRGRNRTDECRHPEIKKKRK